MSTDPPGSVDAAAATQHWTELPLFPLQSVLFPGGLLQLKVFEPRYLDLISRCLRERSAFGVVCLSQGSEVRGGADRPRIEGVAVLAHLQEVDAEQSGILLVRCVGGQRVQLSTTWQRDDGLWLATARARADDLPAEVPNHLDATARALGQAIGSLAAQDHHPFARPYRLDDAGWVANRWCELLPISVEAKYRLMVLDDPLLRLKRVDEFLRGRGMV